MWSRLIDSRPAEQAVNSAADEEAQARPVGLSPSKKPAAPRPKPAHPAQEKKEEAQPAWVGARFSSGFVDPLEARMKRRLSQEAAPPPLAAAVEQFRKQDGLKVEVAEERPPETMIAVNCHRTGVRIMPTDKSIKIDNLVFHPKGFTCAATGAALTTRTAVVKNGEVYHKNHIPQDKPTVPTNAHIEHVKSYTQGQTANTALVKETKQSMYRHTPAPDKTNEWHAKRQSRDNLKAYAERENFVRLSVGGVHTLPAAHETGAAHAADEQFAESP